MRYLLIFGMTRDKTEQEEEKVIIAFWPISKKDYSVYSMYAVNNMGFGLKLGWEGSKKMNTANSKAGGKKEN